MMCQRNIPKKVNLYIYKEILWLWKGQFNRHKNEKKNVKNVMVLMWEMVVLKHWEVQLKNSTQKNKKSHKKSSQPV